MHFQDTDFRIGFSKKHKFIIKIQLIVFTDSGIHIINSKSLATA